MLLLASACVADASNFDVGEAAGETPLDAAAAVGVTSVPEFTAEAPAGAPDAPVAATAAALLLFGGCGAVDPAAIIVVVARKP